MTTKLAILGATVRIRKRRPFTTEWEQEYNGNKLGVLVRHEDGNKEFEIAFFEPDGSICGAQCWFDEDTDFDVVDDSPETLRKNLLAYRQAILNDTL